MTRTERHEADLAATLALLKKPHSAEDLARILKISEQAAHNRLKALRARGHRFRETHVRLSSTGPKTTRYSVLDRRTDQAQSRGSTSEE